MDANYKAVKEGINRARLIRLDLKKHPTEYFPEKVRGLNKAYIDTVKEIIRQGDIFIDKNTNFDLGLEIAEIVEKYRDFLQTLNK